MDDFNTDEARVERRKRLVTVRPLAAEDAIRSTDYISEYEQPHVVIADNLLDVEESKKALFCPACRVDMGSGLSKVCKLHVSYARDPLNNYPMIATVRCGGCDFVEMIPVIREETTPEERRDAVEWRKTQGGEYGMTASQMQMQQAYSQQKMAALGQMYGVGANDMAAGSNMYRVWQDEFNKVNQAKIDQIMRQTSPPIMHVPGNFKLGFGQQLANEVWENLDRDAKIRNDAKLWREHQESKVRQQQSLAESVRRLGKTVDQSILDAYENNKLTAPPNALTDQIILDAKRLLEKNDHPKGFSSKYWDAFRKKYGK